MDKLLNQIYKIKLDKRDLKVFVVNFVLIFVMVFIQHLHLKPPEFITGFQAMISPIPAKLNIFDQVLPKLQQKDNNFKINKPSSMIPTVQAATYLDNVMAYGVIDFETGEVLAEKNLERPTPIASITKIMSAVVALDLATPNEVFTVSDHAANIEPTKLDLHSGDQLTLEELLNGALLTSANDCVQVIEEGIDQKYGSEVFIRAMNEKAQFLGMKNSKYTNPQGLDNGSPYSSVEDQAILMHYALNNYPLIAQIVHKDHGELLATSTHTYQYLNNWNGLIGVYPGTYGIKIGNTDDAKNTTAVVSQRSGKKILAIVLGAAGSVQRDLDASQLLDMGFQKLAGLNPVDVTEQQLRAKYASWKY